jgi:hypothetical protein
MRDEYAFNAILNELRAIEPRLEAGIILDKQNHSHWAAAYFAVQSTRKHLEQWYEEETRE